MLLISNQIHFRGPKGTEMKALLLVEQDLCRKTLFGCLKLTKNINFLVTNSNLKGIECKSKLVEPIAPVVAELLKDYTHFVAPTSSFSKSLLPRVGALLDTMVIGDVIEIKSPDTFVRPIYAGNALCTVKSNQKLKILNLRPTSFENSNLLESKEQKILEPKAAMSEIKEEIKIKSERPELTKSKVVVCGGRGLKSKQNFDLIYKFADQLKGAVGASRAAVDAGYADNSLQIGQTGKVVAPDLYIGVGISGAIQHLAGMKDSKVIVAINQDPDAPIFQVADLGIVGDLFEIIPKMQKLIK